MRPEKAKTKAQKAKMKGNEAPKGQNKENEAPKGQNERKWNLKRPKWSPKRPSLNFIGKRAVFGNLWERAPRGSSDEPKVKGNEGPKKLKWKEMKAQKAKMKKNEGPKGQNERKWRPKRPKWKEMKAQKAKMKRNEGPKGEN